MLFNLCFFTLVKHQLPLDLKIYFIYTDTNIRTKNNTHKHSSTPRTCVSNRVPLSGYICLQNDSQAFRCGGQTGATEVKSGQALHPAAQPALLDQLRTPGRGGRGQNHMNRALLGEITALSQKRTSR